MGRPALEVPYVSLRAAFHLAAPFDAFTKFQYPNRPSMPLFVTDEMRESSSRTECGYLLSPGSAPPSTPAISASASSLR